LTAHLWEIFPLNGQFTQLDPDSVLFSRLLEQSILKGKLVTYDSYGCYPYDIALQFPPFYPWFLYNATVAYYSIFPGSQLDPMLVAGFLPIVVTWLCIFLVLLTINRISRSTALLLFCSFFMLPGGAVAMASGFLKLDYDFLNAFLIWSWILSYLCFDDNRSKIWQLTGSLAACLFVGTWAGSPFFFFFATAYGVVLWLSDSEDADKLLEYTSVTLLIGGMVNLIMISPEKLNGRFFAFLSYSYFQATCVVLGGLVCLMLKEFRARKISRWTGMAGLLFLSLMLLVVFRGQMTESTGFLFQGDPIHKTISELASPLSFKAILQSNANLRELLKWFGWSIVLFPLFAFLPWTWCDRSKSRFLRFWLTLMLVLTFYQIRYIRWLVVGEGLYYGITCYLLWTMIVGQFKNRASGYVRAVAIIVPLMILQSMHNFHWSTSFATIDKPLVELYTWIRRNTPETSGYFDEKKPEYGILSFWDEGNHIAFYARRPAVVNNAMWGYKTMADIFSAKTEDAARQLCQKYGVRYIVMNTFKERGDGSYTFWNTYKNMPEVPEYSYVTAGIVEDPDYKKTFFFWLLDNLALGTRALFDPAAHFRLVYASDSPDDVRPPWLLYENVAGARVSVQADPSSVVQISIELTIGKSKYLFKKSQNTDENGLADLVVPYSTSHKGGRIQTEPYYKVSFYKDSVFTKAMLQVAEVDVLAGNDVGMRLELLKSSD
jgi:hypothetical protein